MVEIRLQPEFDEELAAHTADSTAVHGISNTAFVKAFVNHGSDPNVVRPSGFVSVEWFGTVEPVNALDGDTWINIS